MTSSRLVVVAVLIGTALAHPGRIAAQKPPTPASAQSGSPTSSSPPSQTTAPPAQPPSQTPVQTDQTPTFKAGINFVRVDVIITDKKGEPVGDLTSADFQVFEDDKPQTIEQFKLVRVNSASAPGDPPLREIRTVLDQEQEAARDDVRLFVIFFDDYHTRDINAMRLRQPLQQFIQTQISPKDLVAFMYPLSPLDTVNFTRDQAKMQRAVMAFEGRKYRYEPRNQFEEQYSNYPTEQVEDIRNQVSISALRALSIHLGGLHEGRKTILYVGEGFGATLPASMRNMNANAPIPQNARPDGPYEETIAFFNQGEILQRLRDVFDAANRSNTAIYTLDPRGLATQEFHIDDVGVSPDMDRRVLQLTQDTLRTMAEQTDGRALVNRNDVNRGLAQMVRDSTAYYLLGYTSNQAPDDGRFHAIEVNLSARARARGLQVRARRGYQAPTADDVKRATGPVKAAVPKPVEQALASMTTPGAANQYVRSWVGLARGANGKTKVTYVWEPLPAVPGIRKDTPGRVALIVASPDGALLYRGKAAPAAATAPSGGASSNGSAAAPPPGPAQVSFEVPPGTVQLRIAVEGTTGGVLDSEVRDMSVPDLANGSGMSTARVYRARTPRDVQALAQDATAVPVVGRDFSRVERAVVRFDVYGTGDPSAALLNRAGQKMVDVPVASTTAGATHQIDLGLSSIAPGEYVLEISGGGMKQLVPLKIGS